MYIYIITNGTWSNRVNERGEEEEGEEEEEEEDEEEDEEDDKEEEGIPPMVYLQKGKGKEGKGKSKIGR